MILGVPAGHRVVVILVQQQPLLVLAPAADQDQPAAQFVAGDVHVQLAGRDPGRRVVGLGRFPRADVPDDHVAAAVLTRGDHALELQVLNRVILDMHGQPPRLRIERRPVRHGPAGQYAVNLEPEVVVPPPGAMALHNKTSRAGNGGAPGLGFRYSGGFRGAAKVAHRLVPRQFGRRIGTGALGCLTGRGAAIGHTLMLPRTTSRQQARRRCRDSSKLRLWSSSRSGRGGHTPTTHGPGASGRRYRREQSGLTSSSPPRTCSICTACWRPIPPSTATCSRTWSTGTVSSTWKTACTGRCGPRSSSGPCCTSASLTSMTPPRPRPRRAKPRILAKPESLVARPPARTGRTPSSRSGTRSPS